jgi:hypothetical protein
VPKLERSKGIEREENEHRKGGEKLNQDQQSLAVVTVHQHAAERAEYQTGECAAQPEDSQCHGGSGDFISDPIERNFLDEMAYGTQQIHGPENRVVAVAKGVKNANGIVVLPVSSKGER